MTEQQQREHDQCGRSLSILCVLALLYAGCLGAALEGWDTMALICGWSGFIILTGSAIGCTVGIYNDIRRSKQQ